VGRAIARELLDNGHQVLLIDKDPKALKLESVPDAEWRFVGYLFQIFEDKNLTLPFVPEFSFRFFMSINFI
jgi:nucleoside-diphosphate-sugar epimerase